MQGATPAARDPAQPLARLLPRIASLAYETLIVVAVLLCAGLLFYGLERTLGVPHVRLVFQLYLVAVSGIYFVWQWMHGGQTLPMKTWRLRLVTRSGRPLSPPRAAARYALALIGAALCGATFLWALIDRDRQFLHDRLAGTRIVSVP